MDASFNFHHENNASEEAARQGRPPTVLTEIPTAVIVTNAAGKIIFANRQTHRLLGYESGELIGLSIERLIPTDKRHAHVAQRADFNHNPVERPMMGRCLTALRKDGEEIPVEIELAPLNIDGEAFVLSLIIDQTEREQKEKETARRASEMDLLYRLGATLASGENLYHALRAFVRELKKTMAIDAFHVALYDAETDILSYSLFLNLEEDIQPPPIKLSEKRSLSWEVITEKKTLYIGDVASEEARKNHTIFVIVDVPIRSYLGIPLLLEDRAIGVMSVQSTQVNAYTQDQIRLLETIAAQVVVTIEKSRLLKQLQQELSERKRLIEELENKNAELERFAYTVSHDLKSPLVTISGYLGYLEKSAQTGNIAQFGKDKTRIENAVGRMQDLLEELLKLSRVGRLINSPQHVSFNELAQEAVELTRGRMEKRGVVLFIEPNLPDIYGDRLRLIEALQNLLDNATKYMGAQENPRVEIGARAAENGTPIFYVRDNGMGIARKHHERVFGLFNKLDSASEGTGVGLALVKRIIELHKGRIWVESEEGQGATFYFTLPNSKP
ncbi:MAG: PAS domain S-box protein [Anaerolineales bacterium]|nr:PAS domain S-box protein [Anaerolineales bacterium]